MCWRKREPVGSRRGARLESRTPSGGQVIPLSPIDHVFTGRGAYPLEFVFAYGGPLDVERLSSSLRKTLALFPAVGSRLVLLPEGAFGLGPSEDGCSFEAVASGTSFGDSVDRTAFVAPVETIPDQPLARVRLTRTPDGSVLGVSLSHAVVDGFSYFYFLSAWAQTFHGRPVPPPWLDRGLLQPVEPPAGPRRSSASGRARGLASVPSRSESLGMKDVREGCGLFLDGRRPAIPRDRLRWTRRVFPRAELSALLAEAQSECPVRLSHNDVVAAWLWRRHVPEWAGPGEETAFLSCPVDLRRVWTGFPPGYFGCAVALANATIEGERLAGATLADLARRVRDAVAGVDESSGRRALAVIDRLRRQEGLAGLERLHVVHPRAGLLVTNLSRLPVRGIAFDAGPPVAYDILAPAERCAVVLPAEDGLDVRVCLPVA
jgi:shikimate O-hydroxycinnamoyltransferase